MSPGPAADVGAGDFETLLYGDADGVATITLNRPDALNTIVPPISRAAATSPSVPTW